MRLHLFLAKCGVASRRESERIISQGLVQVNGKVVSKTQEIDAKNDLIRYKMRIIRYAPKIYYAFHKPRRVICSARRQGDSPLVLDYIKAYKKMHLFTVGRLDSQTSGLIFVSNDGTFSERVLRPTYAVAKEYVVHTINNSAWGVLRRYLRAHRDRSTRYRIESYTPVSQKCVKIVVTEGKQHEIRNIMAECDCRIQSLIRIRIGNVALGDLAVEKYRPLAPYEIKGFLDDRGN